MRWVIKLKHLAGGGGVGGVKSSLSGVEGDPALGFCTLAIYSTCLRGMDAN